jgi:hypothetical protein
MLLCGTEHIPTADEIANCCTECVKYDTHDNCHKNGGKGGDTGGCDDCGTHAYENEIDGVNSAMSAHSSTMVSMAAALLVVALSR